MLGRPALDQLDSGSVCVGGVVVVVVVHLTAVIARITPSPSLPFRVRDAALETAVKACFAGRAMAGRATGSAFNQAFRASRVGFHRHEAPSNGNGRGHSSVSDSSIAVVKSLISRAFSSRDSRWFKGQ